MGFEETLITQGAPTLAGMKIGTLFHYTPKEDEALERLLAVWDGRLQGKGVRICRLLRRQSGSLLYLYRPCAVERIWTAQEVCCFLRERGYSSEEALQQQLLRLAGRLAQEDFPHEVGLFLGYPLHDVQGFIQSGGRGFCCCGYWKVYAEEQRAKQLFAQFKRCTSLYRDLFARGHSAVELTVAA